MSEQMFAAVRDLPRRNLEDLFVRQMSLLQVARREQAKSRDLEMLVAGMALGAVLTASAVLTGYALS